MQRSIYVETNLEYDGLELSLLDDKREKRKVLSKVLDLFFINGENKRGEEDFRKGAVYAVRDTHRSFFYFWWTAIQSGIKASILSEKARERMEKRKKKKK